MGRPGLETENFLVWPSKVFFTRISIVGQPKFSKISTCIYGQGNIVWKISVSQLVGVVENRPIAGTRHNIVSESDNDQNNTSRHPCQKICLRQENREHFSRVIHRLRRSDKTKTNLTITINKMLSALTGCIGASNVLKTSCYYYSCVGGCWNSKQNI